MRDMRPAHHGDRPGPNTFRDAVDDVDVPLVGASSGHCVVPPIWKAGPSLPAEIVPLEGLPGEIPRAYNKLRWEASHAAPTSPVFFAAVHGTGPRARPASWSSTGRLFGYRATVYRMDPPESGRFTVMGCPEVWRLRLRIRVHSRRFDDEMMLPVFAPITKHKYPLPSGRGQGEGAKCLNSPDFSAESRPHRAERRWGPASP